jgi:hypothetical protein
MISGPAFADPLDRQLLVRADECGTGAVDAGAEQVHLVPASH